MGTHGNMRQKVKALPAVQPQLVLEAAELMIPHIGELLSIPRTPPGMLIVLGALRREPELAEATGSVLTEGAPTGLLNVLDDLMRRYPDVAGAVFIRACLLVRASTDPEIDMVLSASRRAVDAIAEMAAVLPVNNQTIRLAKATLLKRLAKLSA